LFSISEECIAREYIDRYLYIYIIIIIYIGTGCMHIIFYMRGESPSMRLLTYFIYFKTTISYEKIDDLKITVIKLIEIYTLL
jgi:hypothetical protein